MTPWLHANFSRQFPGITIQGDFSWHDRPRRVTALFGPSGCGKTTILRCLAGLERPDAGMIQFHGETWCDVSRGIHVSPQQRRVGFLFQDYMLFPHLRVRDNIAFGMTTNASRRAEVDSLVNRFQLEGLAGRWPRELSGGQQQRVALARVLAAQPRLLCLDEPLSALDGPTRTELRLALRGWLHEFQLPALIVSHDPVEVQTLADDVIVMADGRPNQAGSVEHVWHQPVDAAVARIVGYDNILPVQVLGGTAEQLCVEHRGWRVNGRSCSQMPPGSAACLCVRAEDVLLSPIGTDGIAEGRLIELIPEAGSWRVRLQLPSGTVLQAVIMRDAMSKLRPQPNDKFQLSVAADAAVIVPAP